MKNSFSTSLISSVQRRKQHKYRANAPFHVRHKFLSANLSKDLRKKYGKRNLPLRTGDEVLVMRGAFKKKRAKVSSIDLTNTSVSLENIQRTKKDGTKVNVKLHPSVLQIQTLDLGDKERLNAVNRKATPKTVEVKKQNNKEEKKGEKKEDEKKEIKEKKPKGQKNASN